MMQRTLYTYEPTKKDVADYLRKKESRTQASVALQSLADSADNVLFRITSFFPFDLFPDELIIDETKVTIVNRSFFASEQIYTIGFASIIDVTIETAPFFATLNIRDRGWSTIISIRYLPKEKAIKALKILQGVLILQSKSLDISSLSSRNVLKNVETIGHSHTEATDDKTMKRRLLS